MGMELEFTRGSLSASSSVKLVMFTGVLVEMALEVKVLLSTAVRCEDVVVLRFWSSVETESQLSMP